ncbi:MAG: helix-turn-helix transcriptional regulator [Cyanobacteria bacterium P01_F01_bin.116]
MAARLVVGHYKDWLLPGSPDDSRLFHADPSDKILLYPAHIGQGYRQYIKLRDDLILVIMNYVINHEVIVNWPSGQEVTTKFEFPVSGAFGQYSRFMPILDTKSLGVIPMGQQILEIEIIFKGYRSTLAHIHACIERFPLQIQKQIEKTIQTLWRLQGRRSKLDIPAVLSHLNAWSAQEYAIADYGNLMESALPDELYAANVDLQYANRRAVTTQMKTIMGEILSCPYHGETRRQYLEKKSLDLVASRMQEITQPQLHPDDLDCIYQAASILRSEMVNPPTVEALARQVSTNRLKLNQGFHEVYGTTPFKYLRDCRLCIAQRLLTTSTMSVENIAAAVGYRSRNYFARAFRKQTGLNPKLFQMQIWPNAS